MCSWSDERNSLLQHLRNTPVIFFVICLLPALPGLWVIIPWCISALSQKGGKQKVQTFPFSLWSQLLNTKFWFSISAFPLRSTIGLQVGCAGCGVYSEDGMDPWSLLSPSNVASVEENLPKLCEHTPLFVNADSMRRLGKSSITWGKKWFIEL